MRSRDSSVGTIATSYGLDGRGSIPGRGMQFITTPYRPDQPLGLPIQWILSDLSPGVKRPEREADHLPPSSAEVRNGGAITPLPNTSSLRCA
jgi:hypothetical protein